MGSILVEGLNMYAYSGPNCWNDISLWMNNDLYWCQESLPLFLTQPCSVYKWCRNGIWVCKWKVVEHVCVWSILHWLFLTFISCLGLFLADFSLVSQHDGTTDWTNERPKFCSASSSGSDRERQRIQLNDVQKSPPLFPSRYKERTVGYVDTREMRGNWHDLH